MRLLVFALLLVLACQGSRPAATDPASWVNPFIGTGAHGHTFPGATLPFGMVQLSPDTRLEGWDGCSGYHYTDSLIYGFSHTHLSGTGIPDYCDVLVMPGTGPVLFDNQAYRSPFRKETEVAEPGYYRVELDRPGVRAELTATPRTGVHRYTFPAEADPHLIVDLLHRDEVIEAGIRVVDQQEIEGYRISRSWASEQHVYFVMRFSRPFTGVQLDGALPKPSHRGAFYFEKGEPLLVKTGISAVNVDGARANLDAEMPGWDFDAVRADARQAWNDQLAKIAIESEDPEVMTNFYTALYHACIAPNLFTDAHGNYRGLDGQIHPAGDKDQYTVFSLWDTYRAAHPLYTLTDARRTGHFIQSFLRHYEQGGELPMWELSANETYCMIGYHAVPPILDAYQKGIRDFDADLAMQAMQAIAEQDKFGKKAYREWGFLPAEAEAESVSRTLEYAYDDWCIAEFARLTGRDSLYRVFSERAQSWKNVFDPQTGFMRAKNRHRWVQPFDPSEVNFHYTEANAWQYSFYVPHDIESWSDLLGGQEALAEKLDALFTAPAQTTGRQQADITGLIGQYAHGNEPSHHMAYLYNYAGQSWKTQERVHEICATLYQNSPEGLSGNEDCGQMSAWYVFSALGFYPVNPADGAYVFGLPQVRQAAINLENGKVFEVKTKGKGKYIRSASLNGKLLDRCYIRHEEIIAGGELLFVLSEKASEKVWEAPPSRVADLTIVPIPALTRGGRSFDETDTLALTVPGKGLDIWYSLDQGDFMRYEKPIGVHQSGALRAYAQNRAGQRSKTLEVRFDKIDGSRKMQVFTAYAPQYAAGGDKALLDGIQGGGDFRTGEWQGYEGVNLDALVDLGAVKPVADMAISFLQDENAWIFMPLRVEFSGSADGKTYQPIAVVEIPISYKQTGTRIHTFTASVGRSYRYLRVVGVNRGVCPDDHKGAGGKAWIFADEILIKS